MSVLTLGLVNLKPLYIYVGDGDDSDGNFLWYTFDHAAEKQVGIKEDSLSGYLTELHIFPKKFKGKFNYKLRARFSTGQRNFFIQSGVDTNFSRKLLLSLNKLTEKELKEPIAIQPQKAMEDKVVFVNVLQQKDNSWQFIKAEWNADIQLFPIIQAVQKLLGQEVQTNEKLKEMEANYGK